LRKVTGLNKETGRVMDDGMNDGSSGPDYMYHTRHSHPAQRTSSRLSHRVSVSAPRVRGATLRGGGHREHPPLWIRQPRASEGKKKAGMERVPDLEIEAGWVMNEWVSRPQTICILPGILTPRKGHPRAGFQPPPRGYEELYNPVRAAILYK
jgi:hypothetical protein